MEKEHWHGHPNCGEISPGELRRGCIRNPTRVDISTNIHLGHGGAFWGVKKMIRENVLPRLFFGNTKYLLPIVGYLSTMMVKTIRLGLLNPATSAK